MEYTGLIEGQAQELVFEVTRHKLLGSPAKKMPSVKERWLCGHCMTVHGQEGCRE